MRKQLYLIGIYIFCGSLGTAQHTNMKVQVEQGWLEGEKLESVTGDSYYSFKGIPYAEPPVGKLRFKAPRPPLPWDGVRPAKEHGNVCPQVNIFTDQLVPGSEDCLYLNVYTPEIKPQKPMAVMIFIHGGGYKSGSGNEDNYGPDYLIRHDVVVVTINYRLDALGFLCLDTPDVPGNAGLKDQVMALKWVKENIAQFGGDPNEVTIFGESAGGASTTYHIISPMSKGLFKRAISMSGVPFCDWSLENQPRRRAFVLGKLLGIDTKDPNELLEFLQNVPTEKLINTDPCITKSEELINNILKMYHFTPVVEKDFGQEHFMTEEVTQILKNDTINEVDLLIGHTSEEVLLGTPKFENEFIQKYNRYQEMFVPTEILISSTTETILHLGDEIKNYYFGNKLVNNDSMREMITYSNELVFIYPIYRFLKQLPKTGDSKRFMYKFSAVSKRNVYGQAGIKYGIVGASHLDDLMYLFDAKMHSLKYEKGSPEDKLVNLVCTVFTNFAKYGTPTPDSSLGISWPEFDSNIKNYVNITDTLTVEHETGDALTFWDSIYEYARNKQ
ncbi:hypothetical protein O3G_MSEX001463 [Manduca sexta]|uniref:Carboxylic ester hydrolase n=2 Tax=Manduca sexta TaxID=7130 RepID=A0A921YKF8_MANSE|nr:hypothetical protein O3G_MSEX001463 [Manduca sexta]UXP71965.1 esterase [Manduca sexta]